MEIKVYFPFDLAHAKYNKRIYLLCQMKEQYYYSITNVVCLDFWVRCIVRHIVETQKVERYCLYRLLLLNTIILHDIRIINPLYYSNDIRVIYSLL